MPLSLQEKENLTRWDGRRRGFYEVYYLKWNDPARGIAAWLRYTLLSPNNRPPEASVWGIFFDAQNPQNSKDRIALKETYPISQTRIDRDIFYFSAGPSAIFQRGARGNLSQGQNRLSWELKFGEEGLLLKHFPWPLYETPLPKTKFLAPRVSGKISGHFVVNGIDYDLSNVPAHQGHLWGIQMARQWAWGNCNAFREDPEFCFEGLTAPPFTLLFFYWNGEFYRFNSPWSWIKNRSRHELDRWHFEAGTNRIRFVGDLFADAEKMVGVRYEDTDGSERFCHNTKIADLKIQILERKKEAWTSVRTMTASGTAAYEFVSPDHRPEIPLLIV